jgi:hypothetical protein
MKEDALQKGLPAPDEAAVRKLVLAKSIKVPDLATAKDFLRFHAATGMIVKQTTCDSLNTAGLLLRIFPLGVWPD